MPNHAALRSYFYPQVAGLQVTHGRERIHMDVTDFKVYHRMACNCLSWPMLLDIAGHVVTYVTRITKLSLGVAQDKDNLVATRSTTNV